jgi:hypothetical protein
LCGQFVVEGLARPVVEGPVGTEYPTNFPKGNLTRVLVPFRKVTRDELPWPFASRKTRTFGIGARLAPIGQLMMSSSRPRGPAAENFATNVSSTKEREIVPLVAGLRFLWPVNFGDMKTHGSAGRLSGPGKAERTREPRRASWAFPESGLGIRKPRLVRPFRAEGLWR